MDYSIEEYLNEVEEMKTKKNFYIEKHKKIIDELIITNDFENAFSKLVNFLITIENKDIPYVLKYYDDIMKSREK
jgi:hypothetical protein